MGSLAARIPIHLKVVPVKGCVLKQASIKGGSTLVVLGQRHRRYESIRRCGPVFATAKGSSGKGGFFSSNNDNSPMWDPLYASGGSEASSLMPRCPVPLEQQPINEYRALSASNFFSWLNLGPAELASRIGLVGLTTFMLVAWPVASVSFDPTEDPMPCWLSACAGSLVAMSASLLRLYMGWAYVGNRLFSATVEYEENGWYDGQVWVKPPEVLARDRLLGSYDLRPALTRLKTTLVGLGLALGFSAGAFLLLMSVEEEIGDAVFEPPPMYTAPYQQAANLPGLVKDDLMTNPLESPEAIVAGLLEYCY